MQMKWHKFRRTDVEAIIQVCKKMGVTLIHPGYDFIWAPHFAKAVERLDSLYLVSCRDDEQMGGKIAAKEIAEKLESLHSLAKLDLQTRAMQSWKGCRQIGFPILIKRTRGGGKGMRRVDRIEDLKEQAESAAREAWMHLEMELFLWTFCFKSRHMKFSVLEMGKVRGFIVWKWVLITTSSPKGFGRSTCSESSRKNP